MEPNLHAEPVDVDAVVRRIGVRLGTDPALRAYNAEVIARVAQQTCLVVLDLAAAGAGTVNEATAAIAERLIDDDQLADVPPAVVAAILHPALRVIADELGRKDPA